MFQTTIFLVQFPCTIVVQSLVLYYLCCGSIQPYSPYNSSMACELQTIMRQCFHHVHSRQLGLFITFLVPQLSIEKLLVVFGLSAPKTLRILVYVLYILRIHMYIYIHVLLILVHVYVKYLVRADFSMRYIQKECHINMTYRHLQ